MVVEKGFKNVNQEVQDKMFLKLFSDGSGISTILLIVILGIVVGSLFLTMGVTFFFYR